MVNSQRYMVLNPKDGYKCPYTLFFTLYIHYFPDIYVLFSLSLPMSCTFSNFCWNFVDPPKNPLIFLFFCTAYFLKEYCKGKLHMI